MDNLKKIKESLEECVLEKMQDIESVNTHEMSQAFDMIKDINMAMYYCSIVKAMNNSKEYTLNELMDEIEDHIPNMTIDEKQYTRQKMSMFANELM